MFKFQHYRVSHEADADMRLDPVEEPVIHRTDVQVCLAEAEGPLYHEQVSVLLDYPVIRQRAVGCITFPDVDS